MADQLEVGMKLHAVYSADGEHYPAVVAAISESKKRVKAPVQVEFVGYGDKEWKSLADLKSKRLPKVEAKGKGKGKAKAKVEKVDLSLLDKGTRLQAMAIDGVWYAAEVVAVSTNKSRSKAPIKVNFVGYTKDSDEWVGADKVRSKTLRGGQPVQKKGERVFLFSSESVNEGHPDKLCDQVSDAILDMCLKDDPQCKVACETVTKDNMVAVMGEITTKSKVDYDTVVRGVVKQIGFNSYVDDLSSVDSKGLDFKTCEVMVRINKQSPDIAGGVHIGKDEMDVGAGDQGIMFGYASDETADCMPLTHSMATRLGKKLTDVRKSGDLWWLRPDGKTQVTIQYLQKADGSVQPLKIHTVVISTQHAEPLVAKRSKECEGYTGEEMIAPSMEDMNKLIEQKVIRATLREIKLKNGKPALTLYGKHTHKHLNPTGKFIIGGPQGDAGLTGRKIIIDTYGGWGSHGGGAFSGKDPTKVDRSAAYICRQMAKSVVTSKLAKRCLVQLSYAIGVAKPLSLFVETYGTELAKHGPDDITNVLKIAFDARPGAIAVSLALREPKYQETAAYCHFGREPVTKNGMKYFEWENSKDLNKYTKMSADQIDTELKGSNYLTKWVD